MIFLTVWSLRSLTSTPLIFLSSILLYPLIHIAIPLILQLPKKKKSPLLEAAAFLSLLFQVSHFSTTTFVLTNFLSFSHSNDTSASLIESTTPTFLHVLISLPTDAAAAAKLPQSCPTLCDPRDGSPSGFPVPGIL